MGEGEEDRRWRTLRLAWTLQCFFLVNPELGLQASVGNSHGNRAQGGAFESMIVPSLAQHSFAKQIKFIQ